MDLQVGSKNTFPGLPWWLSGLKKKKTHLPGLFPGPGRPHIPHSNEAQEPQLLSLCPRAQEPQLLTLTLQLLEPASPRAHALPEPIRST